MSKVDPWDNGSTPPEIVNSDGEDTTVRDNMVYLRKVKPTETTLVTKSFTWTSNTVYSQWDHTQEMKGLPFYCITNDYNVYKCLFNNHGAESTVEPTGNSLLPFTTADGYIWKYMYNVPSFKRDKFLTADAMPVQKALTDGFYNLGAVEEVSVVNGGSGYTDVQQTGIAVTGDGTGAILTPIVSKETGTILDVRIDDGGSGYTTATLSVSSVPDGTGIYGNASAVLTPVIYNGSIVNVAIEDPGVNYAADTTTTITVTGDGSGAIFNPVVSDGVITDVIVENPGQDYTFLSLTVTGTGSGAVLQPVLAASDFLSDQAAVEQAAVIGPIYAIEVTEAGNNYDELTTVTIEGDGTGCTAEAVLNPGGGIQYINVLTPGTGYTYANVVIDNPNRDLPNDYTDAEAYVILPPAKGHGFDAVQELYGDTLALYTQLKDDTDLSDLAQDFRQYGILINPVGLADNKRVTKEIYFVLFDVNLSSVSGITVDTVMICNNVKYKVISISGLSVKLQQMSSSYVPLSVSDALYYEADPGTTYVVSAVNSFPVVDKYSGELVYVQNLEAFTPTEEQLLSFRTYITL